MVSGKPPHHERAPMQVISLIPKQPPPAADRTRYSKSFCDFVEVCLMKDPAAVSHHTIPSLLARVISEISECILQNVYVYI
jgi:hypothetical protein